MATIKDIARIAGVSVGTVSRVLNHHRDVSEATRQKVEEVIRQEKFEPNSNARFLKQTSESDIVILIKGTRNYFLESLMEKTQILLSESGEDTSVVFLDESADAVTSALRINAEKHPRGFVFLGGNIANFRSSFGEIKVPAVLVSQDASGLPFDNLSSFCTDDYAGGAAAARTLIEHGHTDIGILGGYMSHDGNGNITSPRLAGAADIFREFNIPFDLHTHFVPSRFSFPDSHQAARKLFLQCPGITAVMTHSDILSIGVLRAAADLKKKVPEDLSIIGFDGIEYTDYTLPRLATVRQDTEILAKRSVEDLLLRINYPRPGVHEKIPFTIEEKESIAYRNA